MDESFITIRWLLGERIQNLTLFRASLILMVITWVTLAMMAKRLFSNSLRERLKSHTLALSPEPCWEVLTAAAWDRAKCSGQCYLLSKQFCLTQRLVFHTSLIVTQKRSGISHKKNIFEHIWPYLACLSHSVHQNSLASPHKVYSFTNHWSSRRTMLNSLQTILHGRLPSHKSWVWYGSHG